MVQWRVIPVAKATAKVPTRIVLKASLDYLFICLWASADRPLISTLSFGRRSPFHQRVPKKAAHDICILGPWAYLPLSSHIGSPFFPFRPRTAPATEGHMGLRHGGKVMTRYSLISLLITRIVLISISLGIGKETRCSYFTVAVGWEWIRSQNSQGFGFTF